MANNHSCLLIAGQQPIYLQILQAMLRSKNCDITVAGWNEAIDKGLLTPEKFELIIIFEAKTAPVRAAELTEQYLMRGGRLITLGAPAFSEETYTFTPLGGAKHTSRSKAQLLQALDHGLFNIRTLLSFEDARVLSRFHKDTSNPDSKAYTGNATLSIEQNTESGKKCLKWYSPDFYINESFEIPFSIPQHYDALTFCAKAKSTTRTITITLIQNDGMMFKTTFLPQTSWTRHLFLSKDFRFAGCVPGTPRPSAPPKLDFTKVKALRLGHAVSHAYSCAGEQAFYIDEIAAARIPFADRPQTVIPGLYPEYKYYPVENAVRLTAARGQGVLNERTKFLLPKELCSISMRSICSGLDKHRRFRFIPLIEAFDAHHLHCGYAAHLIQFFNHDQDDGNLHPYVKNLKRFDGGMLAVFTPNDNLFYCQGGCKAVCDTASFMLEPVHLLEGGSLEYAYFADDRQSKAGAMVTVADGTPENVLQNMTVTVSGCGIHYSRTLDTLPVVSRNEKGRFSVRRMETDFTAADGKLTVTLSRLNRVIDKIECEVLVYTEKPEKERRFAKVASDGSCEIEIGGNITRFYGVNYMPSGCIGNEDGPYHEFYFSRTTYDPEIIRTDLERIADIGMNAVSVFLYHRDCKDNNNLLHFIALCKKYGIYIDLGLRPHATPFQFEEQEVKDLIGSLRLADCDQIVAYDISWERYNGTYEPCYGNGFGRKSYDPAFREYLLLHYGSFENAEREIGYPLPRNEAGEVVGVPDSMLRKDGEHRVLVAVYRKFVDEHVRKAHYKAAQAIKKYDPNHLLTARTGDASTIPLVDPGIYGYDYRCLSPGLDFFSPESYALSENPDILRQILFTNEYSRFCQPNAVVQWKEFGKSIWCGSNFTDNRIGKEIQANFYRKFFDMLLEAHTGGIYAWWWAGGYRIGENSDFGVINPDGSDRPVTKVLREYAPKFLAAPLLPPVDGAVHADRSENATGLEGYYRHIESDFFAGWNEGKRITFNDAGCGRTTRTIAYTLPWYADGAPDSFFMEITEQDKTVAIPVYNPSHCVWDDNVSLLLLDKSHQPVASIPLHGKVMLHQSIRFTVSKADYSRACFLTLVADGRQFGEILRIQ